MSSQNLISPNLGRASVECLPPEHAAESTIICQADDLDNLVHSPSIEVLVGYDSEWKLIGLLVELYCIKTVVSIPLDALID